MTLATWLVIPLLLAVPARAEDPPAAAPSVSAPVEASGDGEVEEAPPVVKRTPKVRRGGREKEAEGTEAPNRFEADTVIKSQYKLDGQLLEVDPD